MSPHRAGVLVRRFPAGSGSAAARAMIRAAVARSRARAGMHGGMHVARNPVEVRYENCGGSRPPQGGRRRRRLQRVCDGAGLRYGA